MRRVPPDAFDPRPSPTVGATPFVQATVTVPVPSRFVDAWATTGSYAPKPGAAVLMVQLLVTVALTPRFAVAVAAEAGALNAAATMATPLTAASNPRNVFARIAVLLVFFCVSIERCLSRSPSMGLVRYPIAVHGRGHMIHKINQWQHWLCFQHFNDSYAKFVIRNRTH